MTNSVRCSLSIALSSCLLTAWACCVLFFPLGFPYFNMLLLVAFLVFQAFESDAPIDAPSNKRYYVTPYFVARCIVVILFVGAMIDGWIESEIIEGFFRSYWFVLPVWALCFWQIVWRGALTLPNYSLNLTDDVHGEFHR